MIMELNYEPFHSDYIFNDNKTNIIGEQTLNINFNSSDFFSNSEMQDFFINKNTSANLYEYQTNPTNTELKKNDLFLHKNSHNKRENSNLKDLKNLKHLKDLKQTRSRKNQRLGKISLESLLFELLKENYCQECKSKIEKYFKEKKEVSPDQYDKIHYKENNKDARILTEPSKKKGAVALKQGVSKTFLELVNKKILVVFAFTCLALLTLLTIVILFSQKYVEKSNRLLVSNSVKNPPNTENPLSFIRFENQYLEILKSGIFNQIQNENDTLISIEKMPDDSYNEELIIQHRILFELMLGDAPFLRPKEFFKNMKFICFWEIFLDKNYTKSDFSYYDCGKQFLRKYNNSKEKLFNLLQKNNIHYSEYISLPGGVKNVLIFMSYMEMTVGWEIENFLNFIKEKDFFSAAKLWRISFWGKNLDRQVYYNSFLLEKGINSMVPSYLADIENYKEEHPIKFENSYITYNFFICYKALLKMTIFETEDSQKENILSFVELVNLEEYNPSSIFYKHGKFKFIYEQIYYAYYSNHKIEITKVLYVKELMEKIFFFRKENDVQTLHDYVKTLNIKSDL